MPVVSYLTATGFLSQTKLVGEDASGVYDMLSFVQTLHCQAVAHLPVWPHWKSVPLTLTETQNWVAWFQPLSGENEQKKETTDFDWLVSNECDMKILALFIIPFVILQKQSPTLLNLHEKSTTLYI